MGKRIIQRARGKGGPTYRSPGHRFAGAVSYPREGKGTVADIIHDPARDAPLAILKMENKSEHLIVAAEGMKVGQEVEIGEVKRMGSITTLSKVPKGAFIFAIETVPGSGPKLCCSAGTKAILIGHDEKKVMIQMPSKAFKKMNPNCRATIGIPAGSGLHDKPLLKAGKAFYAKRARNKLWPKTSAVAMNAVDHPFGGQTKPGTSKSRSRHLPPGAKVGSIASKRTGKRKR